MGKLEKKWMKREERCKRKTGRISKVKRRKRLKKGRLRDGKRSKAGR